MSAIGNRADEKESAGGGGAVVDQGQPVELQGRGEQGQHAPGARRAPAPAGRARRWRGSGDDDAADREAKPR